MKRKRPSSSGDEEAKRFLFDKIKVEDIDIPYEHTDIQSQKPDDEDGCSEGDTNDNWLRTWDIQIHECSGCEDIFRTQDRLRRHLKLTGHDRFNSLRSSDTVGPNNFGSDGTYSNCTVIASLGDVIITAGPTKSENFATHRFLVSSQVLSCQSPVFAKIFGTENCTPESLDIRRSQLFRPRKPAVIYFDDDPDTLELVFNILHLRHRSVPEEAESIQALTKLAEVCEKYFLHVPLYSWARKACRQLRKKKEHDTCTLQQAGNWVLLAWTFGFDKKLFNQSCQSLCKELVGAASGATKGLREKEYSLSSTLPKILTDRLYNERRKHITAIRYQFKDIQAQRIPAHGSSNPRGTVCQFAPTARSCDLLNLGLLTELTEKYDLNGEDFWNRSLREIEMVFNDAMVAYRKLLSESSPKGLHSWADRCCWVNDMVTIIQNHKDVCFAVDWKLTDYKCREGLWEGLRE